MSTLTFPIVPKGISLVDRQDRLLKAYDHVIQEIAATSVHLGINDWPGVPKDDGPSKTP